MKIVFEIERLSTNGGIERILTDRINYMAEEWGWDVTVVVLLHEEKEPYYKLSPKVRIVRLEVKTRGLLMCAQALWRLNKVVRKIKPDIYTTIQSIGALSCLLNTHRTTTIYEAHGTRARMPHPIPLMIAERFADAVVVLTKYHKEEYAKAKRIEVIPNYTTMRPQTEADYKAKMVVSAGRICYEKNFERLEAIWDRIKERHSDWQLNIHHDTKDMVAAYLEGSIYVMTSRFEGFPMVLVEAMTCGLPVVAFDCPYGPRAMIEDGKTGYLIPYDNDDMFVEKLTYLMEHPEERERMGRAAKESVKRFSQEEIMSKWKKLYCQL
ncbi:MAG: glycosyltransferase family 4 protein [Prevotella sp.]|nr:glycosyltransferase family 4 protein [Prevotella sp.]MBR1840060.1 glycosyltransferase family 4 protein [Prevotella sp.]